MKTAMTCIGVAMFAISATATTFENIRLDTNLDVGTMTNIMSHMEVDGSGNMVFKRPGLPSEVVEQGSMSLNDNMVFHQLTGLIEFRTDTNVEWQTYSPLIDRIVYGNPDLLTKFKVNGKTIPDVAGNPIYGKKIAVVGDSEINGAYECDNRTTYPNYIVQRNNMTMFQTCTSKLAMPRYPNQNPSDGITYVSLIGNYASLIPGDVDIIWIHCSHNDAFDSETDDDATLSAAEFAMTDEQCRQQNISDASWRRSYKKSFNTLMEHLTNEYQNARIAVALPYNFGGQKTSVNNFIKKRCAVYGIEYIDAAVESGFTLDDTQYFTVKADGTLKDQVHLSRFGSERISWMFENFMKTRMQISPRKVPQRVYDADDTNNITNP